MRKPTSPRATALLLAFVIGAAVFTMACLGDVLLLATRHGPWLAAAEDLAIGAFAAAIVLYYEWRRNTDLRRKLSIVAEMNHHVRNQLEIIEYSARTTNDKAHITRMQESVAHIEWALREILGHDQPDTAALPPAKPPTSVRPARTHQNHDSVD